MYINILILLLINIDIIDFYTTSDVKVEVVEVNLDLLKQVSVSINYLSDNEDKNKGNSNNTGFQSQDYITNIIITVGKIINSGSFNNNENILILIPNNDGVIKLKQALKYLIDNTISIIDTADNNTNNDISSNLNSIFKRKIILHTDRNNIEIVSNKTNINKSLFYISNISDNNGINSYNSCNKDKITYIIDSCLKEASFYDYNSDTIISRTTYCNELELKLVLRYLDIDVKNNNSIHKPINNTLYRMITKQYYTKKIGFNLINSTNTNSDSSSYYYKIETDLLNSSLETYLIKLKSLFISNIAKFKTPNSSKINVFNIRKAFEKLFISNILDNNGNLSALGKEIMKFLSIRNYHNTVSLLKSIQNECSLEVLTIIAILENNSSSYYSDCNSNHNYLEYNSNARFFNNRNSLFTTTNTNQIRKIKQQLGVKEGDHLTLLNIFNKYKYSKNKSAVIREGRLSTYKIKTITQRIDYLITLCELFNIEVKRSTNIAGTNILKSLVQGNIINIGYRMTNGIYKSCYSNTLFEIDSSSVLFEDPPQYVVYDKLVYRENINEENKEDYRKKDMLSNQCTYVAYVVSGIDKNYFNSICSSLYENKTSIIRIRNYLKEAEIDEEKEEEYLYKPEDADKREKIKQAFTKIEKKVEEKMIKSYNREKRVTENNSNLVDIVNKSSEKIIESNQPFSSINCFLNNSHNKKLNIDDLILNSETIESDNQKYSVGSSNNEIELNEDNSKNLTDANTVNKFKSISTVPGKMNKKKKSSLINKLEF